MHVHIDPRRIDLEEQHEGGMALVVQHVVERLADGVRDQPVAHEAAVDEEVLVVARAAIEARRGDQAMQPQARRAMRRARSAAAANSSPSTARATLREAVHRQTLERAAVVLQRERYVGARQRDALERLIAMRELGVLGAQKLAARRCVVVEVAHFDCGAGGGGGGLRATRCGRRSDSMRQAC